MENRRKKSIAGKLFFISLFVVVFATATTYIMTVVIEETQTPTVYMTHGDQDTCVKAKDAQGMHISCAEAMKGAYHTEWVASKELIMGLR